ncbi:MAG: site-specific integrase [Eggerthellaceae bacterium]|nr:site-specific integrase [Eggerthellaceae bacterium]
MKTLQSLLSGFLLEYLPRRRGFSGNTVESYRDSLAALLRWFDSAKGVRPETLTVIDFDAANVSEFAAWLVEGVGRAPSTANNRLAAIKSFMRYCQLECPEASKVAAGVLSLKPMSRGADSVDYLTVDAVRALVDAASSDERDHALVSLLYDSGCRVSEIAGCVISDMRTEPPCTLKVIGKGRKARVVPISAPVGRIVTRYLASRRSGSGPSDPLFVNRAGRAIGRAGIAYVLSCIAAKAHETSPDTVPEKVNPHRLRHSKAMHMLEAGVNLIYIRDFLGHSSVTTTEVYARANPEMKRKAIEDAGAMVLGASRYSAEERQDLEAG